MNILQPAMAMVGLTSSVWTLLFIRRIPFLQKHNIDPQTTSTPNKREAVYTKYADSEYAQLPANNLANLCELPVIFYAVCIIAYQLQLTSPNLILMAWVYVLLRAIHSLIQCTYNKVMHRFIVYFLSCLLLWMIAVMVGIHVFKLS